MTIEITYKVYDGHDWHTFVALAEAIRFALDCEAEDFRVMCGETIVDVLDHTAFRA